MAGHIGLSSPDEQHVCKPCSDRELAFYRRLPEALVPHTARLCGYAEVRFGMSLKPFEGGLEC